MKRHQSNLHLGPVVAAVAGCLSVGGKVAGRIFIVGLTGLSKLRTLPSQLTNSLRIVEPVKAQGSSVGHKGTEDGRLFSLNLDTNVDLVDFDMFPYAVTYAVIYGELTRFS